MSKSIWITRDLFSGLWRGWAEEPAYLCGAGWVGARSLWCSLSRPFFADDLRFKGGPRSIAEFKLTRVPRKKGGK